MDLTHLHLLLNHVPTVGMGIGLGIFLVALIGKSGELKRASLVIFVGIALLTIPTYVSGNGAQAALSKVPEVSKTLIATHEGAALIAFSVIQLTGAAAWLGLWQVRRMSTPPRATIGAVLVLALIAMVLVARAANIGGEIRHPEIRGAQETVTLEGPLGRTIGLFITSQPWAWPACEALHFIGLTLLMGVVLAIDLRMLGIMPGVSFQSLHRLLPWAILGFGINAVTGMLFFVGSPEQYQDNIAFGWKLGLMMLAGANALYFTIFDGVWQVQAGDEVPVMAKAIAVSALVLWVGVMYFGSMLPFIGGAF